MNEPYGILTTPDFDRDLAKLDRQVAGRIAKKLEWLACHPDLLSQPLRNLPARLARLQKYRIGDYRVLLWVDHAERTIILYAVAHRSSIYRNL